MNIWSQLFDLNELFLQHGTSGVSAARIIAQIIGGIESNTAIKTIEKKEFESTVTLLQEIVLDQLKHYASQNDVEALVAKVLLLLILESRQHAMFGGYQAPTLLLLLVRVILTCEEEQSQLLDQIVEFLVRVDK